MISWLKNNKNIFIFNSNSGSALPVVLMFATAGLITVTSFLYFHLTFAKPSLQSLAPVQALFNARSGIYKGFHDLVDTASSKVLPVINTLDSSFGKDMFSGDSTQDTSKEKLTFNGGTVNYKLYSSDSLGECTVSLIPAGGSCILHSVGTFKNSTQTVDATLGSRIPALPDTVIVCYNTLQWEGVEPKGKKVSRSNTNDTSFTQLKKIISNYRDSLTVKDSLVDPPLTIQANKDFQKIPQVVHGDLLIDGSFNKLYWKDTSTIKVLGRLEISNDVTIENVKFAAAGEIVLSGKTTLINSNLFSESKIFIGDNSIFQGNALALNSVAIYGNSQVQGKSTIIVFSDGQSIDTKSDADKKKKIYSIEIGDQAIVDGIFVALGSPGDIKTHSGVKITGVMIAQKNIGHLGKMKGLMCAGKFIDPDVPETAVLQTLSPVNKPNNTPNGTNGAVDKNILKGEIEPLFNIKDYKMPFFLGKLIITGWKEY